MPKYDISFMVKQHQDLEKFVKKVFKKLQNNQDIYSYSEYKGIVKITKSNDGFIFTIQEYSNYGLRDNYKFKTFKFSVSSGKKDLRTVRFLGYI